MRKGLFTTFLLAFFMVIFFNPESVKAGNDLGTMSKDAPDIFAKFSLQEEESYYCFFAVDGGASDITVSLENKSGTGASAEVEIADITDQQYTVIKTVVLKSGEKKVTDSLPDFKDGDMYFMEVKNTKSSGTADFELNVLSKGLGGETHDFTKLVLSKDSVTLDEGKAVKLKVTLDKSLKDGGVKWKSSDKKVAVVSKKGKVKAKSAGYAVITCTSKKDKKASAKCNIYVEEKKKDNGTAQVTTSDELIKTAELILSRTGQPLYLKLQGGDPSSQTDSYGNMKWAVMKNLNGTINYIAAYEDEGYGSYNTFCIRSYPCVTVKGSGSSGTRDDLKNGSYDFASDPSEVVMGWSMWTKDTTKKELEGMINSKISDDVYDKLIDYSQSSEVTRSGGSAVIVYGKDKNGVLVGKYAGAISYNQVSNATVYYFTGVYSGDKSTYGKEISGTASY